MPGPMPKPAGLRQRRNKAATRALLMAEDSPRVRMPELPELPGLSRTRRRKDSKEIEGEEKKEEWHPMARRFWELVWSSPMRGEFLRADEAALFRLVFLVDQFWKRGSLVIATEIRMLEREFGLTPLSRRRLEWTVAQAEEATDKREVNRARRAMPIDVDPRGVLDG